VGKKPKLEETGIKVLFPVFACLLLLVVLVLTHSKLQLETLADVMRQERVWRNLYSMQQCQKVNCALAGIDVKLMLMYLLSSHTRAQSLLDAYPLVNDIVNDKYT